MSVIKIGFLCGVLLAIFQPQSGHAASKYWSHGGSDNLWTNGANWLDGIVPTSGDIIYLGNNCPDAPQTILIDSSVTFSNIECTATGSRNYTLTSSNGATITMLRTGRGIAGVRSVDLTINADIYPDPAANFLIYRDGNNVTINGRIVTPTRAILVNNTGTLTLNGSNSCTYFYNNDGGDIVCRDAHALGDGYFRNDGAVGGDTLFLATNVTLSGNLEVYNPLNIRLTAAGTNDVTFLLCGGCNAKASVPPPMVTTLPGTNGSTGRLYLKLTNGLNHTVTWSLDQNTTLVLANPAGSSQLRMGINNETTSWTGTVAGAGSVLVDSGSSIYLWVTNSYTGGTVIRNGTLFIQANDRLPPDGSVTVEAGGMLTLFGKSQTVSNMTGNGIVQFNSNSPRGTNIVTGTLAPGLNGRGTLTYTNSGVLTLTSSTVCEFELGATNEVNDKVVMAHSGANITLAGKLKVIRCPGLDRGKYTLVDMSGPTPAGSFDSVEMPPLYRGTVAVEGGDLVLTITTGSPWGSVFSIR